MSPWLVQVLVVVYLVMSFVTPTVITKYKFDPTLGTPLYDRSMRDDLAFMSMVWPVFWTMAMLLYLFNIFQLAVNKIANRYERP